MAVSPYRFSPSGETRLVYHAYSYLLLGRLAAHHHRLRFVLHGSSSARTILLYIYTESRLILGMEG